MSKKKKETMEFRFYEIPQEESVLALLGDAWVRVYGHDEFRLHFHNLMEIGLCRRGEGVMYYDEEKLRYQSSMISMIPANYPHITISDGGEENFWEYLFFDPQMMIAEMFPDNLVYQKELLEAINKRPYLINETEYPSLASLIKMIMEEMRLKKPHYKQLVKGLMCALCMEILRTNKHADSANDEPRKLSIVSPIAPALELISTSYAEQLKAADLAAECNMSETHFRRMFEQAINMSPMDYLNLVRIQKACDMLKKTNDSMDVVALRCGFPTTSTFNRNFKKFLDTSPYQWKINPSNYERKLLNFNISALKGW